MINDLRPSDPVAVGKYRLLGRLGAGGMGQVYLARSPGGRQVAIKVIRPEYSEDPEFRIRFRREVAAARNVGGMFTADVVDAQPDGPEPWMATAYVPGPSLGEAVGEKGPLPPESVLALAAGLAEGLDAIHAVGLIHRDLKPTNVLLSSDGPRVIDFGISYAREGSSLTETSAVMGTPGYMSPEQARGLAVGPASDVFSLGAVLTFAATGHGPFGTGPVHAMIYRVVHEQADLSEVPDDLRPLIERCLAKVPEDRPTTTELLAELGPLVSEITGNWLPEPVVDSINRYVMTTPNEVAPPSDAAIAESAAETPSIETPSIETPSIETPPAESLATESPSVESAVLEAPVIDAPASEPTAAPLAQLVTAGFAADGSARADETAVVAVEGAAETQHAPIQLSGPDSDARRAGPATPPAGALDSATPAPLPSASPALEPGAAEHDGGGPPARRRPTPARRWPLAAAAAGAIAIAAAVVLVLVLSPPGTAKVIGGGTPSALSRPTPTVIGLSQPTPSRPAAKKPKAHPTHTARASHSTRATTPATTQTTQTQTTQAVPQDTQTTPDASQTTPTASRTTPSPTQHTTTAPASGPQTISSASGAASDGCGDYGTAASASGGAAVSYTFQNDSSADIQVWYLTSSGSGDLMGTVAPGNGFGPAVSAGQDWMVANSGGGCIGLYTISASGEIIASS